MDKHSSATQSRKSELDVGASTVATKRTRKKKRPARPSPQQILAAFDGDIEPVKVGVGFRQAFSSRRADRPL
jgi:hypothetical protein